MTVRISRTIHTVYTAAFCCAFCAAVPYFLVKMITRKKYRAGLAQRLGIRTQELKPVDIWFHSVSVGEAMAARPLIERVLRANPSIRIAASATTDTGISVLRREFGERCQVFYYPLDLPFAVSGYLEMLKPRIIAFMETEIWPVMIYKAVQKGIQLVMLNGRISDRSYRRYRRVHGILSPYLQSFSLCAMQSRKDAGRIIELGADHSRVKNLGNIKYSAAFDPCKPDPECTRSTLGIACSETVIVCGSTHQGEEKVILNAFDSLRKERKDVRLILVPRHPHRGRQVLELCDTMRIPADIRSKGVYVNPVLIVDTIGELRALYAMADIVFIGKSLFSPGGGQNMLEPAAMKKTVMTGPYTDNFREIVARLKEENAITIVASPDHFEPALRDLLAQDKKKSDLMGQRAFNAVVRYKETVEIYYAALKEFIHAG